jgi:hypothetical protein
MTDQPGAVDPDGNAHRPNQQRAMVAEIRLAHLHPGIRHIALADDAVRLEDGGSLENAALMANHASTRTTQLYDRCRARIKATIESAEGHCKQHQ